MRRNLLVAVLVGTLSSLFMWGVSAAQGQGRPAATGADARVALVDIAYIFKNYDKFTRLYEQMKSEVKQREKEIGDAQNELKSLLNQKQQFTPDSPNYKQVEQKLAQRKADLEVMAEGSRREFTQKEASLYHQTYQEVEAAIKSYAEYNKISLVLRASRDPEESTANNPQEVIKEVSQMVIYALPHMDITDAILEMLNAKPAAASNNKSQPTGPSRTTGNQPSKTANQNDARKPSGGTIKK